MARQAARPTSRTSLPAKPAAMTLPMPQQPIVAKGNTVLGKHAKKG